MSGLLKHKILIQTITTVSPSPTAWLELYPRQSHLKVKDVVLNGVYDYYQRGRVSNILKTFNHVNMNLDVDGRRVTSADISDYKQVLNMKEAKLTTSFDVSDKVAVKHD